MLKKVLIACIDSPKFLVCGETKFYEIFFTFFIFLNHGPLSSITLETRSSIALSTVLSIYYERIKILKEKMKLKNLFIVKKACID